ncbi:MAG TPA: chromate transporter [Bacillota bacterium]|nr:chromate transporter [Bacillota bacterium]HPT88667.1 chromate transporter [Bacillota bacterium]
MIYLQLFWIFFKIGLFSFGGGYVMIPLMQKEIETHGWIPINEFADIVAVSQMTPGPLAVNAATYIGQRAAGIMGSFSATLGVSLPSLILVILIARAFLRFKENPIVERALRGIRPATAGMIAAAMIFFAEMSIFTKELPRDIAALFSGDFSAFKGFGINPGALFICIIIYIGSVRFKLHPITAVVISAILGIFLT